MPRPGAIADACGRALRRSVPAIAATCIVLAVGAGVWFGYRFVTTSSRYAITSIEVRGASRVSADEIRAAIPVRLGHNVFKADLAGVGARLRNHPWIAEASAHRILPDTLVVEVREHVPAAIAVLGEPYLVDRQGHAFKRAQLDAGDGDGLPVITGVDRAAYQRDPRSGAASIQSALDALASWREPGSRPAIGEIHIDPLGAITLRTYEHGASIQLGQVDLPARMHTFDAAWAELSELERTRARAIHLDARTDHVIVAFAKD